MPAPRSINIGPYSFPITPGYTDGSFAIGASELEVLDTARAERVRKKGFKVLEKIRARSKRRTLSEGELRHLSTTVAEFDREVRLEKIPDPRGTQTERPTRLAAGMDDIGELDPAGGAAGEFDAEVARLAGLRLAAEESGRGITLEPAQREAAMAALAQDPSLREAARARVEVALAERERLVRDLF